MSATKLWHYKSFRLYLSIIFCIAVLANALIRNALSMAIVCMVNTTYVNEISNKSTRTNISKFNRSETCLPADGDKTLYEGPFLWTHAEQGFLFSALFIGGLVSTLPAGWLSDRYDPKLIVTVSIIVSTLGCYLIPVTAWHGGYIGIFILRFIMGFFGQTILMSGVFSICARWIPPTERSTVLALYSAGNQIANIIGMPLNAALCESKEFLGGWPAIFYVNGTVGILAFFLWIIFVTNQPEKNKFVNQDEKLYIQKMLSDQNLGNRREIMKIIPWTKMLTSKVFISCIVSNFTAFLLVTTLMTYLPTYFKEALFLDLKSNGIFSALPYVCQWISKMVFAIIADFMKKKTNISHTLIAKLFTTIGSFGTSMFLIACAYMDCTKPGLAVMFLCLSNTMISGNIPGYATSLASMAPAYSGIIGSFARFAGQIGAIISPLIVSSIVVEGTDEEWRIVFLVIAGIVLFGGILFNIFGSGELQDWAKQHDSTTVMLSSEKETEMKEIMQLPRIL